MSCFVFLCLNYSQPLRFISAALQHTNPSSSQQRRKWGVNTALPVIAVVRVHTSDEFTCMQPETTAFKQTRVWLFSLQQRFELAFKPILISHTSDAKEGRCERAKESNPVFAPGGSLGLSPSLSRRTKSQAWKAASAPKWHSATD